MQPMNFAAHAAAVAFAAVAAFGAPAARADIIYSAALGPEAVGATGSGSVLITYLSATNDLSIHADWSGLSGTTNVAHIHCCTAVPFTGTIGVAVTPGTLPGFPVGVSAGSYDVVVDLDVAGSFTATFVNNFGGGTLAGARDALLAGLDAGRAYFNIHTLPNFPGGEIRGFPQRVPEPGTLALLSLALGGALVARRRRD